VQLLKDRNMLLSETGLKKLDLKSTNEVPTLGQLRPCRSLEVFLVLGAATPPASCPQAAVTLLCPRWPPRANSMAKLELRCFRGLFLPDTASRMLRHLTTLLDSLCRSPKTALCQLPLHAAGSPDETEISRWADAYSSVAEYWAAIPCAGCARSFQRRPWCLEELDCFEAMKKTNGLALGRLEEANILRS
ncbi:unnamed protein product, partial [Effrenium voratum]